MELSRLAILDGLRFIAILMVMLYHYYDRYFIENYIQYNDLNRHIFSFGYLGVELFFIISGFVITMTLDKSSDFIDFMKRRLIRLFPAMLLCSIITYLYVFFVDTQTLFPESKSLYNLLISNTFVNPVLLNRIFDSNFSYIDGVYWSLWVEICFYIIISFLYFYDSKKLQRNFFIVSVLLVFIHYVLNSSKGGYLLTLFVPNETVIQFKEWLKIFNITGYILWFYIGMRLFELYNKKNVRNLSIFSIIFFFQIVFIGLSWQKILFGIITFIILISFIYKPRYINFLGNKFLARFGIVSYAVYLLHQNIGVLIINKLSFIFNSNNWIIGVFLIFFFFFLGDLIFRYYEMPMIKFLRKRKTNT